MESLTRYRRHPSFDIQHHRGAALPAIPPPGLPPPGVPLPGSASVTVPVHNYPADGPTVLGYTVTQLQALDTTLQTVSAAALAALPLTGGTLSGNLRVNASIGINQAPIASHGLDYLGTNLRVSLTDDFASWQNNMGVVIDKTNKASTQSQCVVYGVGGKQCWAAGMDVSTNTSGNGGTGNGDFVPVFDATAGWNDDGSRSVIGGGADVFRFTPSEEASGGKSTTWDLNGASGANKNTTNVWGLMTAGVGLSGVKLSCNHDNSRAHLFLEQRAAGHQYVGINLDQRWLIAQDISAANAPHISFFDSASAAANKTRLWIEATGNEQGRVGVNTASPAGLLSVSGDNAAAHYDVVQTLFAAGYSNSVANRSISFQQILNASAARQYLWLNGGLGSSSVVATPTATSTFAYAWGLESADTTWAVVNAGPGSNQTIIRPFSASGGGNVTVGVNGGNISFLGAAGTGRNALPAAATDPATTQALANAIRTQLITLGLAG